MKGFGFFKKKRKGLKKGSYIGLNDSKYVSFNPIMFMSGFTFSCVLQKYDVLGGSNFGYLFSNGNSGLAVNEGNAFNNIDVDEFYFYDGATAYDLGVKIPYKNRDLFVLAYFGTNGSCSISINNSDKAIFNLGLPATSINNLFSYNNGANHFFNGKVKEMSFFEGEISEINKKKLYNKGKFLDSRKLVDENLLHYFKCNQKKTDIFLKDIKNNVDYNITNSNANNFIF
jgi:hypothetical protein